VQFVAQGKVRKKLRTSFLGNMPLLNIGCFKSSWIELERHGRHPMHASALSKHYLELARKPVNDSNFPGSQEGAKS